MNTILKPSFHRLEVNKDFVNILAKVKQNYICSWAPPLLVSAIPGFGPIYIKVIIAPMIVKKLSSSLSKGLDYKKIVPIDGNATCYQNHPQAKHCHTIAPENFPFKRKLRIADDFNSALNSVSDAFKLYNERRNYFYETLNQEMSECVADNYRILSKDAFRNAWIKTRYEGKPREGLKIIDKAIDSLKNAKKECFRRPKRELLLLKSMLLDQIGEASKASSIRLYLENISHNIPITDKEKKVIKETIVGFAFDQDWQVDSQNIDGLDTLFLWAKTILKELDCSKKETLQIVQKNISGKKSYIHIQHFMKAIHDNLAIVNKHNVMGSLIYAKDYVAGLKSSSRLELKVIKALYQDFISSVPAIELLEDQLTFIENAALAQASLDAFYKAQNNVFLQRLFNELLASNEIDALYFERGEHELQNKKIILLDTFSPTVKKAVSFLELNSDCLGGLKLESYYCPMKSLYQVSEDTMSEFLTKEKMIRMLRERFSKVFKNDEKAIFFCHQRGEELFHKAVAALSTDIREKIKVYVFSPTQKCSSNKKYTNYIVSAKDRLSQLFLSLEKALDKNILSLDKGDDNSTVAPKSHVYHPIYLNKFINLINNFIN